MLPLPPRHTPFFSSAASVVYKGQAGLSGSVGVGVGRRWHGDWVVVVRVVVVIKDKSVASSFVCHRWMGGAGCGGLCGRRRMVLLGLVTHKWCGMGWSVGVNRRLGIVVVLVCGSRCVAVCAGCNSVEGYTQIREIRKNK